MSRANVVLGGAERRGPPTAAGHAPQLQGALTQLVLERRVEHRRVLRVPAVGVQRLRHQPVLVDEVVHHVPLAAVRGHVAQQRLDQPPVHGLARRVQDLFKEPVCLFQLVPVEQVGLRQLKRLEPVLGHEGDAEDVGRREEPAPPAAALVGHGPALQGDLDVEDVLVGHVRRLLGEHLLRVCRAQRREGQPAGVARQPPSPPPASPDVWLGLTCFWDPAAPWTAELPRRRRPAPRAPSPAPAPAPAARPFRPRSPRPRWAHAVQPLPLEAARRCAARLGLLTTHAVNVSRIDGEAARREAPRGTPHLYIISARAPSGCATGSRGGPAMPPPSHTPPSFHPPLPGRSVACSDGACAS